jgi:hypothetical protein
MNEVRPLSQSLRLLELVKPQQKRQAELWN